MAASGGARRFVRHKTRGDELGTGIVIGTTPGKPDVITVRWPEVSRVGGDPTVWGYYRETDLEPTDTPPSRTHL